MGNLPEEEQIKIPETLPLLPVRDTVIFPYMILPLFVGRETSIKAVDEALAKDRMIFLATQKVATDDKSNPRRHLLGGHSRHGHEDAQIA